MTLEDSDKIKGCVFGGALGDAWGSAYEGNPRPSNPVFRLTDDTQLTLATQASITRLGRVDPEAIAEEFLAAFRKRRLTGLGASTLGALRSLDVGAHWALAGLSGEKSAGNGAAMRIAPLAFVLDPGMHEQRRLIREVCRITHHNEEAYVGALAVVMAIQWAMKNQDMKQLIAHILPRIPDSKIRDQLQSSLDHPEQSITDFAKAHGCSGYVVESVPLALFAAQKISQSNFTKILEALINVGGDTDTNASITGQIMGAMLGFQKLPKALIQRLLPDGLPDFPNGQ